MPPRIRLRPCALCASTLQRTSLSSISAIAPYASVASIPASTSNPVTSPAYTYPPTQPPSHKPPAVRKTQLHRQYQSLLKSSPLILIFQHNNLKAIEWMSIRRELAAALQKVDVAQIKNGHEPLAQQIQLKVIQTNIFASALRIVEFFNPESNYPLKASQSITDAKEEVEAERFTHGLSRHAYEIANNRKLKLELEPLLSGPLAVAAFPNVTPQYLKTVLSILAPSKPDFPAPSRKANPDYYEPYVQAGLQKLMLLGARVEGKVFDMDGTKWVAGIDGGIDGLRAQLVHVLQGVGGSLTNAVEGASRSLYFTFEARRLDLEEREKEKGVGDEKQV